MRITVVGAKSPAEATLALRDLGCTVRESSPMDPPEAIARGAEVVVIEADTDAEVGRFALARLRGLPERIPVLLAVATSQLTRIDPSWGYDDVVLQPYVPQELYVRIRGVEWKVSAFSQPERVKVGPLVINPDAHEATLDGRPLALTPQEFALLTHLARYRGRSHARAALLREVWGVRGVHTRTVDVHVSRLRGKIGAMLDIVTVRGVGYRLRLVGEGEPTPTTTESP